MRDDNHHIELETKIAFLEKSVSELSDVVYEQQQALDALQQNFVQIADKLFDNSAETAADTKPPHY